jgi:hypothetical protein
MTADEYLDIATRIRGVSALQPGADRQSRRQKKTTMTIARICKCRTRWTVELKNSVIGVGVWWTVVRTFDTREHADRFCQAHGYILST